MEGAGEGGSRRPSGCMWVHASAVATPEADIRFDTRPAAPDRDGDSMAQHDGELAHSVPRVNTSADSFITRPPQPARCKQADYRAAICKRVGHVMGTETSLHKLKLRKCCSDDAHLFAATAIEASYVPMAGP